MKNWQISKNYGALPGRCKSASHRKWTWSL